MVLWWDGGQWLEPTAAARASSSNASSLVGVDEEARTVTFGLYHTGEFAVFESHAVTRTASVWVLAASVLLLLLFLQL